MYTLLKLLEQRLKRWVQAYVTCNNDDFVPYTGASQNVDLGVRNLRTGTFRTGTAANNTSFEADGTMVAAGAALTYRDEYTAGDWVNPVGGAPPDPVTVTIGGVAFRLLGFDGNNTTEWTANSFEIQHDIAIDALNAETEKLEWHVHFMPSNNEAGDVKWRFEYCILPLAAVAIPQTTVTSIVTLLANTQYKHYIASVELPKPAGGYHIGDIILFNIKRIPTDEQDTYGSDALLLKTALHVPVDTLGSRQRYEK